MATKLVILATGEVGAGKDTSADNWATVFHQKRHTVRVVSISDEIKREYADATGADLGLLLDDRAYKEQHRPALTLFWQKQVQTRPQLPEEHFIRVVNSALDVDVLIITGMRDEAPVTIFSPLVPESRVLDVCIQASKKTRRTRLSGSYSENGRHDLSDRSDAILDYSPSLTFSNDTDGTSSASKFAEDHLLPYLHADFDELAQMVRSIPDFPRLGINFRHILGIAQQPGGLALCTSLLQNQFCSDWKDVSAVVCPEVGGIVFASALALRVGVPLCLIRDGEKLPPPTISVPKPTSYITTALASREAIAKEHRIEMERGCELEKGLQKVVVVDDVLSTGKTLCAVLDLLKVAGVGEKNISVMVVAEFPKHRGREMLRQHGFGRVSVQSLLVFGGD